MKKFCFDKYSVKIPYRPTNVKSAIITLTTKVAGHFTIEARKVSDDSLSWRLSFPNHITTGGLNALANTGVISYCYVGSGNVPPTDDDTAMSTLVGVTSSVEAESQGVEPSVPRYSWYRRKFRFDAGEAAGNLTEVGIGWYNGLFARTLIKDEQGVPTSKTVLIDEYLDVTYEVRLYSPTADEVTSITVDGVARNVTTRPATVTNGSRWDAKRLFTVGVAAGWPYGTAIAYDGPISASITGEPSGASSSNTDMQHAEYVSNTYRKDATAYWSLNSANFATGIKSILFVSTLGSYQIEFDTPIMKTAFYVFDVTLRLRWGRYVA